MSGSAVRMSECRRKRACCILRAWLPAVLVAALLLMAWPRSPAAQTARPISGQVAATEKAGDGPSLLPKTLIYITVASLTDLAIGYVVTGGLATGTAIAVVNSTSGWALYHLHETAWAAAEGNAPETERVTVEKTGTFTVANSVRLLGIGLLFTQNVVLSVEFLVLNALGDAGSYIATDRIWAYVGSPGAEMPSAPR